MTRVNGPIQIRQLLQFDIAPFSVHILYMMKKGKYTGMYIAQTLGRGFLLFLSNLTADLGKELFFLTLCSNYLEW